MRFLCLYRVDSAGMPPQELGTWLGAKGRLRDAQTGPGESQEGRVAETPITEPQTKEV
jgi:hypothetical protein